MTYDAILSRQACVERQKREWAEFNAYPDGLYPRDPEPSTADRMISLVGMGGFLLGALVMAIMAYELFQMVLCQ